MHNFRKALKVTVLFFLICVLLTMPLFAFYYMNGAYRSCARKDAIADDGKVNLIMCGDSQSECGFIPKIYDELSKKAQLSFNAATSAASVRSRCFLAQQYITRNPVDTVIIDLCYYALSHDYSNRVPEETICMLDEVIDPATRIKSFFRFVPPRYYYTTANYVLETGLYSIKNMLTDNIAYSAYNGRGYFAPQKQCFDPDEQSAETCALSLAWLDVNKEALNNLFDYCDSRNIRVVVVTLPVTEWQLDHYTNEEDVRAAYTELCARRGYRYIDMNALDDKAALFPDTECFSDEAHLNNTGAEMSTRVLYALLHDEPLPVPAE